MFRDQYKALISNSAVYIKDIVANLGLLVSCLFLVLASTVRAENLCAKKFEQDTSLVVLDDFQQLSNQNLKKYFGKNLSFRRARHEIPGWDISKLIAQDQTLLPVTDLSMNEKSIVAHLFFASQSPEAKEAWRKSLIEKESLAEFANLLAINEPAMRSYYTDEVLAAKGLDLKSVTELMVLSQYEFDFDYRKYVSPTVTEERIREIRTKNNITPDQIKKVQVVMGEKKFEGIEVGTYEIFLHSGQIITLNLTSNESGQIKDSIQFLAANFKKLNIDPREIVGVKFFHNHPGSDFVSPLSGGDATEGSAVLNFLRGLGYKGNLNINAVQKYNDEILVFSKDL